MAKLMKPKGKKVSGCDYTAADEEYEKKQRIRQRKEMKTAGIAKELKLSEKDQGYSKKPRVKGQKKNGKPVMGQNKVY